MERVKLNESEVFDFSAALHVSQFLRGEIVKKRHEDRKKSEEISFKKNLTETHLQAAHEEEHICCGMCENCTCNKK